MSSHRDIGAALVDPATVLVALVADPAAVDQVAAAEVPELLATLAGLEARLRLRLTAPPGPVNPADAPTRVLPVAEVASRLGIKPREVRRLFARPAPDGLPHVALGPKTKGVLEADLAAFLARQRTEPPPARRRGRESHRGP